MVQIIDIHCHLTFKEYDVDREQVIADARQILKRIVISGVDPEDARKVLELAAEHKNFISVTLGLHPVHVERKTDKEIEAYAELISKNRRKIVGIGEVGLDHHRVRDPLKLKRTREVFVEFLGLAKEFDLPVLLHLRGSGSGSGSGGSGSSSTSSNVIEEGLKIIQDEDVKRAVFHCFTGKPKIAEIISDEGYYISLPTLILRSKSMKNVAKRIPLSRLLTETDAPYLSPDEEEERNLPQNVKIVYDEIARQKRSDVETVEAEIERNFTRLFGDCIAQQEKNKL